MTRREMALGVALLMVLAGGAGYATAHAIGTPASAKRAAAPRSGPMTAPMPGHAQMGMHGGFIVH